MPKSIQKPEIKPDQKRVRFCFDCFQPDHPKFHISRCSKDFLEALLRRLVYYQSWTMAQFTIPDSEYHRHPITFGDTTELNGFTGIDPFGEDLWTDDAWQFDLGGVRGTPSFGWRVHGFFVENVFQIIWLDPDHLLDSPVANHPSTNAPA